MLASQGRQLRPQVGDLDRSRAKLGARRGQLVPQCGDLLLGRAVCQIHAATIANPLRWYNSQHRIHPARAAYLG